MNLKKIVYNKVETFPPGYFSLVMATGILAIATHIMGWEIFANTLFWAANIFFIILLFANILRLFKFFKEMKQDLLSHNKGAGYLSFVAASCVLGVGYLQIKQLFQPAGLFFLVGFIAWIFILYSFLLSTTLGEEKPSFREGMNGSWLLIVISTQSLAILSALLMNHLPLSSTHVLTFSLLMWLLGFLFYLIFITLIIFRLNFYPVKAEAISPSFWMDAGAAAVSVLAGVTILNKIPEQALFSQFEPVIQLIVLLLWAASSWWLILLFLQEGWRHYKVGFSYTSGHWSLVFPLGVYAVASVKLSKAIGLPFLNSLGSSFIYIAGFVWIAVFAGMLFHIFRQNDQKND